MKPPSSKTELELLTQQIQTLNKNLGWKKSLMRSIVIGFGTAIGASILVTAVALVFGKLTGVPILGQFFTFLVEQLPEIQ